MRRKVLIAFAVLPFAGASPLICLLVARAQGTSAAAASTELHLQPPTIRVPRTFFGLHIHRAARSPVAAFASRWPTFEFGSWRLWDSNVQWPVLEPARGKWNFQLLDTLVALAHAHRVQVLLPLALTPRWASSSPELSSPSGVGVTAPPQSMDDWKTYVDTVVTRYRGRIGAYEIWNEPNLRDFYSGTVLQLAELTRIAYEEIKRIDPAALVVAPSVTGGLNGVRWDAALLDAGVAGNADVIGFHFYVTPRAPEAALPIIDSLKGVLAARGLSAKPIWDTETGWLIQNSDLKVEAHGPAGSFQSRVLNDSESTAYVSRALILAWCSGVRRYYWYAWDNGRMGMTEADRQSPKPIAAAYRTTERWLFGKRVTSCDRDSSGVWRVALTDSAGRRSQIVWLESASTEKPSSFPKVRGTVVDWIRTQRHERANTRITGHPVLLRGR